MKDIIEYKLLTGKDNSEFCNRVTKFLNDGWELYGSPFMNIRNRFLESKNCWASSSEKKIN